MRKQRQSRSKPEGKCNTCGQKFQRNRPRQRKCTSCWKNHKFKCVDCKRVYLRRDDVRVCAKCLRKIKQSHNLSAPPVRVREDGSIIGAKDTDKATNALLTKIGGSYHRGRTIDVAVGAGSKHIILASELARPEQRGDDALDAEFYDNQQERAEMATAMPSMHPQQEVLTPADATDALDTDASWLADGAIEEARILKHVGWFLTTPTGIVRRQTGLHQQTIARMRKQLRTDCHELAAKAVAQETAKMIAEALSQQRALAKLRAQVKL